MLTDAPVVQFQEDIADRKRQIDEMRDAIGELRERRISAPENGGIESWLGLSEDHGDIDSAISEFEERIEGQQRAIEAGKQAFAEAMGGVGAELSPEQVDLLLESVTGADLVRLAAAYEAVRGVSEQLRALMDENGEDLTYAKRYYGMHTALIALVLEAQGSVLDQIDGDYLPKLRAIEKDIDAAAAETRRLLRDEPTRAQRRVLEANRESQGVARDALTAYREILRRQRAEIAERIVAPRRS